LTGNLKLYSAFWSCPHAADGWCARPARAVEADTGHPFVRRADNPKLARRLKPRDGFVAETAIRRDHQT